MESYNTKKSSMRVKLIFNPIAGSNDKSPVQLMEVIKEMQAWKLVPEPYLIEPDCDLSKVVGDAIASGIKMIVVFGGDGTVSTVARAVLGTNATFGIIPGGTRNNVALSLGIPTDIPSAVAILRNGRRTKIDIGISTCNNISTPFIELCSVGLFCTLFSAGDDIQHGNIARIGDFLTSLTSTPPSDIHLWIDDKEEIQKSGHIVIVSNMPYVGINYQVGAPNAFKDGLLDVLFFAELSKIYLMSYVIKGPGNSKQEDPRIQHFKVKKVRIDTKPSMSIMADGINIGQGSVQIEVRQRALTLMAPSISSKELIKSSEIHEK